MNRSVLKTVCEFVVIVLSAFPAAWLIHTRTTGPLFVVRVEYVLLLTNS